MKISPSVPARKASPEDYFVGGGIDFDQEEPEVVEPEVEPEMEPEVEPEIEPSPDELEPAEPVSGGMSDKDYQDWIKYDELNQRLSSTRGNILKAKRSKRSYDPDDIRGDENDEVDRLVKLKKSLEDRINTLVAGSSYLQDKIAQEKEKNKPQSPSIEDLTDDDDLNEGKILDEWTINKWKYYAGIRK